MYLDLNTNLDNTLFFYKLDLMDGIDRSYSKS